MAPDAYVSLDVFHHCMLQPGEGLALFRHNLKKLLGHRLCLFGGSNTCHLLLLHQFLASLPYAASWQLIAVGKAKSLQACSLGKSLTVDGHGQPRSGCGSGKWACFGGTSHRAGGTIDRENITIISTIILHRG